MTAQLDTPAARATFTVLDFETTGSVAGWPTEPWQIGLVEIVAGRLQPGRFDSWLHVAPERPFNPYAPGRHAQLRDELAEAPTLAGLWPQLAPRWVLGRPLVAHNIATERVTLRRAWPLLKPPTWIDTLRLVRRCYPHLSSAALEDVTTELDLQTPLKAACSGRAPHDALYDATACALLLLHFLSLPGWENVTLQALIDLE